MSVSFLSNWIFPLVLRNFSGQVLGIRQPSIWKKIAPTSFVFFTEIWFPNWARIFLHQYQKTKKIYRGVFCKISTEITAFRWKIAAVNLNCQLKFYDNGASAVLRTLTAVSAELPAVLEKLRRISKKFRPYICDYVHVKYSFLQTVDERIQMYRMLTKTACWPPANVRFTH